MKTQTARKADINGYIEIDGNPISRAGVFQYSGRSIGDPEARHDVMYNVYRPEEELNNPETIESFKLVPLTDDHPSDLMGVDGERSDDKPLEGVIGERVWYDPAVKMLKGNLKIFTNRVNRAIEAGKRDVSAGFRCVYEKASGVHDGQHYQYIQRKIRGNHASLVMEGRAGPEVAVLDHFNFSFDAKEAIMAEENVENGAGQDEMTLAEITATIKAIGPQVAALTEALASLTKPAPADELNPEEAPDEGLDKCMDALEKRVAELEAKSKSGMDSREIVRTLEQRNALYDGVSKLTGAFVHTGMDAKDIAAYAIDKLELPNVPAGAEIVAVEAYLAAAQKHKPATALDAAPVDGASAIANHLKKGA